MEKKLNDAVSIFTEYNLINSDIYNGQYTAEQIDAYTKVTMDTVLGPIIKKYKADGVIPDSFMIIRDYNQAMNKNKTSEVTPNPVEPIPKVQDPTLSLAGDIKEINEKIANTEKVMTAEPATNQMVDQELPKPSVQVQQQKNNMVMQKKLTKERMNSTGYANIVLMSIIVIIIVAIICVFIFM